MRTASTLETLALSRKAMRILTAVFVLWQLTHVHAAQGKDCIVPLGAHPNRYLPVIASQTRGILRPAGNRSILIKKRERVHVACAGKNNNFVGQNVAIMNLTCKDTGRLESSNSNRFTLNCTKDIDETINETDTTCGSNSKTIFIGWSTANGRFFRQIEVCFNYNTLATDYTHHIIHGDSVPFRDRDVSWQGRASFKQDKFFSGMSPSIATSYSKEKQKETLTLSLGSRERAEHYIGGWGPSSYLAKGHLSPDADFALQSQQDATYHFINVAPQWQEFNNGNWKVLENASRIKATTPTPHDLHIFTGTYGIVMLQDTNGNDVPFYLAQGNKRQVPVPKYIWKIVADYRKNESVAFVLLNQPATNPTYSEPPVCNDVCNRIHWVSWKARNDPHKGVMYCCSVSELRQRFRNIPREVPGTKLLER
ncbi:uncharacterized protein LOC124168092 [Ischnura elegans]|uniref:uncharacterized protein LOC124168092 n=1 Tax=Ischnura elegans TaxID=197161 RepID=UPI001ED89622|nr:uncharacterized protein LOC124168092 [Ischnura elegans]